MRKSKNVLVVGDIMLDEYIFGMVNRISPEAPVPILKCSHRKDKNVIGGAGNVAVNVETAGCSAFIMGVIGRDDAGNKLLSLLNEYEIHTDFLLDLEERFTTSKLRYIGQNNQQVMRIDDEEVLEIDINKWSEIIGLLRNRMTDFSIIILSDYGKGVLTEELSQIIINLAAENHVPVFVDVKGKNSKKYFGATLIKPNRGELSVLTGMPVRNLPEVEAAAKRLCSETKCEYVLTTLGAEGMILISPQGVEKRIDSVAQEVFDVTGAGDTTIAYLASGICMGMDYIQAMEYANYAAGVQVGKVGTSMVYPYEVEQAQKDHGGNVDVKLLKDTELLPVNIKDMQNAGKKIVFTNGCFDILHVGHISYLKKAKEMGDVLVVGVNSDESVRRLKGSSRPVNTLEDRMELLAALECVDYVVSFSEDTPYNLIQQIRPDVLVKGDDYKMDEIVGADVVAGYGGIVKTIPLVAGKSTTGIINKIAN
ncbi:MAG: D-glycero-beta-D-manno-heptose 1-phosphate adenylyltransferase [Clostridiales bacterium]|nr:D-glycero-beta-D-manno-heptose 1-phosphate adenylyltransferase [Clostridiales bacterium]